MRTDQRVLLPLFEICQDLPGIIDGKYEKGRLRSDCADAQADLSLTCSFCFKLHGPSMLADRLILVSVL